MYPNPANNKVVISGLNAGVQIVIRDIAGRLMFQTIATSEAETINSQSWSNGMYMVTITQGDKLIGTSKLVKE